MKYKVRCTDNEGNDDIIEFNTEEEAERAIEDDLNCCKEFSKDFDYDYADFGNKTEFWISGGNEYVSWERLWMN